MNNNLIARDDVIVNLFVVITNKLCETKIQKNIVFFLSD